MDDSPRPPVDATPAETPYFVVWSLRQTCTLRAGVKDNASPDQVERRLKVLREASDAVTEGRTTGDLALGRATTDTFGPLPCDMPAGAMLSAIAASAQGFSLAEVLANYAAEDELAGGGGTIPCASCSANVLPTCDPPPAPEPPFPAAGCFGLLTFEAGWTGDLANPDRGGTRPHPFAAASGWLVGRVGWEAAAAWLDAEGTGRHGQPLLDGFLALWPASPVPPDRREALTAWADTFLARPPAPLAPEGRGAGGEGRDRPPAAEASPMQGDSPAPHPAFGHLLPPGAKGPDATTRARWARFRSALHIAEMSGLPLDVTLVPPGVIQGRTWTVAAHCPRCRVVADPAQRFCKICRRPGGPTPARTRLVRGDRPYLPLTRLMPPDAVAEVLRQWAAAATPPPASGPSSLPPSSSAGT